MQFVITYINSLNYFRFTFILDFIFCTDEYHDIYKLVLQTVLHICSLQLELMVVRVKLFQLRCYMNILYLIHQNLLLIFSLHYF